MNIDGDSNKSNTSMVSYPQILQYSIIMHQTIHSSEKDISQLLNLLKLLLLKRLICGNAYLTFITIWSTKEILVICKRKYKSRKCYFQ